MSPSPFTGRDFAAALSVIVIWGLNFVAVKLALRDFTPMQLGAARFFFAAVPLVLFVRKPSVPWKWMLIYGFFQGFAQFGLLFLAMKIGMTAALASVLMQTQVLFTALFGYFVIHEKLTRPLVGGLVFAGLGLACFSINFVNADAAAVAGLTLAGFILNLGAASMWAASNIVARLIQRSTPAYAPLQFIAWCSLTPVLPFLLMSWLFDGRSAQLNWENASLTGWIGASYLGWIATTLGYGLWTKLLKKHSANRVAPFSLGVPVVGVIAGVTLLGEHISLWQSAGIVCIVMALLLVLAPGSGGNH